MTYAPGWEKEDVILRRAVEEGLVTQEEVDRDGGEELEWGPRVSALLRSGLLTLPEVRRLAAEITQDDEASPGPRAAAAASGQRFDITGLIGEGGMGTVHRAYDSALKRNVALKFLRSDDPDRLARFLREAQAQARVDHENVCRVYEVGELDGRPYIAMQLIEGRPLFVLENEAARPSPVLQEMPLEQKVRVMQKVAEAIHAAHREGLIHRDIKPSNVMLEQGEDGAFKPYVLDFGLAREVASAGVTSLGLAAGTPNFMAPEQARGESLDRRTDVYGLGATLYALLSGHPPFEGPSSLDVLVKVTEAEAPPLEGVPEDLATIVAKCLQKEPAQRYDSARALAEDLGRYLDGDPIRARKTSLAYRLGKKARKHRKLVAAGAAAVLAFLALAITSVRAQLRAQERARLAGVFGQEVKGIESLMRIAHLAPEHDVRAENATIRQRTAAIEAQVKAIGSVAEGPGYYALGRGHLALQEHDQARQDLEKAWNVGYREREVAYALGQVMGALYDRELQAVSRISDAKQREERTQQAQKSYRDPALAYLEKSRGLDVESPEQVEALVAFYEKRYPEALQKAAAARKRLPWLYEAHQVEALVHATLAREEGYRGGYEAALEGYGRAEAAYHAAMEVGRSDPSLPEGLCRLAQGVIATALYGGGVEAEPRFAKGLPMCDRALRLDPDNGSAHEAKLGLYARMVERESLEKKDPREKIAQALEVGREAIRRNPGRPLAYSLTGRLIRLRSTWENEHGLDAMSTLREAIPFSEKALELDPTSITLPNEVANGYYTLGQYQANRGEDPRPSWRRVEPLWLRATGTPPGYRDYNRTVLSFSQADWEMQHGQDPRAMLARGLETIQRAIAMDPKSPQNLSALGNLLNVRAQFELVSGSDPRDSVAKALENGTAAIAQDRKHPNGHLVMINAHRLLAEWALDHGQDPREPIREGFRWVDRTRTFNPEAPPLVYEVRLALLEARWHRFRGTSPEASLQRARTAAAHALRVNPRSDDARSNLARAEQALAEWQAAQGRSAAAAVGRGLAEAQKILAINPAHARSLAVRGALQLVQARQERRADVRRVRLAEARESLERALAINRFLAREYGSLLEQARQLS